MLASAFELFFRQRTQDLVISKYIERVLLKSLVDFGSGETFLMLPASKSGDQILLCAQVVLVHGSLAGVLHGSAWLVPK